MPARFETTQWSQVLKASEGSSPEAREALETLCLAYWLPLYAYVRRRGEDPETARDLTQSFFAELLEKEMLKATDRSKGRFRSFLLASLANFLSHERAKAQALKRGGGIQTVSLDLEDAESRYRREPSDGLTPERVFEQGWALAVMERAMTRLSAEGSAEGRRLFARLEPYLSGSKPSGSYREIGAELGMTEGAVKTAVYRLRRRYGTLLREEIAATVADPADVESELRHVLGTVRSLP